MCTSKSTTSSLTHEPPNVFGYVAAALTIAVTAVVAYMEARLPHQRSLSYATNKVATPSHGTLCTRWYGVPRPRSPVRCCCRTCHVWCADSPNQG